MLTDALIDNVIRAAFSEDLNGQADITTQSTIPTGKTASAVMRARQAGVLCGVHIAARTFQIADPSLTLALHAEDGAMLEPGQDILTIAGNVAPILTAERTALNFLTHLSGIASLTQKYVALIEGTNAKILDTRKTLPGLRALQKYAAACGGGVNHRFGLYDAILIKDNHIAIAGGIAAALDKVKGRRVNKIEIEVDTLEQLQEVLYHGGADVVMLDNMDIATLKKAVQMARGKIITEASGGVSLENVRAIAETGVDYISVGALTHSAPALDIGLDITV